MSTSYKKGDKAALGNDKSLKLSTWLNVLMDKPLGDITTVEGYDEAMQTRQMLALKFLTKAVKEKDTGSFKAMFSELADRTEGKSMQPIQHSGDDEHPIRAIFVKPETLPEE